MGKRCTCRSAPAPTLPRTWKNFTADELQRFASSHPLGATWGREAGRADVLAFDPDGKNERIFATGIRNCVGMAIAPATDTVWCSTNERDGLGDDVPPDYITRVREGAFYGWPWYYIGANEDPRHKGERPDLKDKVTIPDVLLQAHSASLGMTFYDGTQFPADYRGDIFAAEHGSWNRSKRTGYKIIRVIVRNGVPTGEYDDFATGFVINDSEVWGRPVGVTVAKDGALLDLRGRERHDLANHLYRQSRASPLEAKFRTGTADRNTRPINALTPRARGWRHCDMISYAGDVFRRRFFNLQITSARPLQPSRNKAPRGANAAPPNRAQSSRPTSRRASTPCRSGDFTSSSSWRSASPGFSTASK